MSTVEKFFSVKYAGRGDLFQGLSIWEEEKYRKLQGTYPVISLSFANVKESDYRGSMQSINRIIEDIYNKNIFLLDSGLFDRKREKLFQKHNLRYGGLGSHMGTSQNVRFPFTVS